MEASPSSAPSAIPLSADFCRDAQKVFDVVLLTEPTNFYSLYGKALALHNQDKVKECLLFLDEAIKVKPPTVQIKVEEVRENIVKLISLKTCLKARQSEELSYVLDLSNAGNSHVVAPVKNIHKCSVCDKTFTKRYSLIRHSHLHTGIKSFTCPTCDKGFIQKSDMERHLTTHSTELNFACIQCAKRFKTKKNLNCHLVTHSDVRPFKCTHCEKTFKVKRLWQFHEGLHMDQKPFNCSICHKGFPAKPYLKSHMKTHQIEKPFVCSYCNAGFKRKHDLSFHIRKRHKGPCDHLSQLKQNVNDITKLLGSSDFFP